MLRVSAYAAEAERAEELLSAEERERVSRFIRAADRDRYRTAHVALRRELAARTGERPEALEFVREPCPVCGGPHGRPALAGEGPHFSLSHAGDVVLLGFAAAPVGVDVEEHPRAETVDEVATTLHPSERAELAALDGVSERAAAFARCWSRKEAYLKGTGTGLGEDPSVTPVGTAAEGPASPPGWHLADIAAPEGYAAAYAVRTTPPPKGS